MRRLNGVRNVLFDLDGTLVDSRETILASIAHALESLGLDPGAGPAVDRLIGKPLLDIFTASYGMDRERAQRAIDLYREYYDALNQEGTRVYDGVHEGLAELAGGGYSLYVATVKPTPIAEKVLADLDLRIHFSGVAGASMGPERRGKTAIIAHALQRFGLVPGKSLMIGDRDQDIDGARENGLRSLGVTWGFGSREELDHAAPDHLAERFRDIPQLLSGRG